MKPVSVQLGDVFVTANNTTLGFWIRLAERVWAKDGNARYGHAGIILDSTGTTFEALPDGLKYSTLDDYFGTEVLIVRPVRSLVGNPVVRFNRAVAIKKVVDDHLGQRYPSWRILLHIIPPLARATSNGNHFVCSELTARYLHEFGAWPEVVAGINPDDLADALQRWKCFELVYKGVWK